MKPNFALNLSDDSIGLLHRTRHGWTPVGETRFDTSDLDGALGALRDAAETLAPKGVTTKIVIPNSQILYTQVHAPGPDAATRRTQIRAALDGRTPYAVDDLVFDWSGDGPDVMVAVLARDTLDEAEGFATQHRFNPVSFVAIPPAGQFDGEPWFGVTGAAAGTLSKGSKVVRDTEAVALVPDPAAEQVVAPVGEPAAEPMPAPEHPDHAPDTEARRVTDPLADAVAAAEPETPPAPEPEPVAAETAEVPEPVLADSQQAEDGPTDQMPQDDPEVVQPAAPEPFQAMASFSAPRPEADMAADKVADDIAEEAPFTHVADISIADVPEPAERPAADDLPPAPSQAALIAFASRRGAADRAADPLSKPYLAKETAGTPASATPMPGLVAERLAARAQMLAETGGQRPAGRIDAGARGNLGNGAFVTAPSIVSPGPGGASAVPPKKRKGVAPVAAPATVTDMPARKPLTKPGGTFASSTPVRGKPRYLGLILTGILLLFLALIAAWSSFFIASQSTDAPLTDVAAADPAETDTPAAIEDEMLADAQDPADFVAPPEAAVPEATVPETAVSEATAPEAPDAILPDAILPETDPAIVAEAPEDPVVPEPEPEAVAEAPGPAPVTGVDATVPAAAAPEAAQDEIVLSSMDSPPPARDAAVLPQPVVQADAPPAQQMAPPPFGTVYQFDAAGLILPTPEGIVTPEGVLLVAGAPTPVPPPRPATLAVPVATPTDAATPDAAAPQVAPLIADPALANARPRVRPEGLVPAGTVLPGADDAALTPETPIRSTSLIPRARPATILAAGEEARLSTEAASLAASAAAAAASETAVLALVAPDPDASPMAVSVSRVPAPRPRDLEKAVAAAVAAASRAAPAPEPEPVVQRQAAAEPEAEEEPEVAEAAPTRPTGRSVAEQATFVNAISLNRINLIGVYGTQSNRYALIRQANGRYKKVSVGDRIDGGTVAAITDDEVRYQKGGRMLALEMPRG